LHQNGKKSFFENKEEKKNISTRTKNANFERVLKFQKNWTTT